MFTLTRINDFENHKKEISQKNNILREDILNSFRKIKGVKTNFPHIVDLPLKSELIFKLGAAFWKGTQQKRKPNINT